MGQTLRPYQRDAVNRVVSAFRAGKRRVLLVMPTGGGKTSVFATMLHRSKKRGLVLVHRRELATQAADRLREFGSDYGLILAGMDPKPYARIQVASIQTLVKRECPDAEFVVIDEAHLSTAETYQTILDNYPHAWILGVTATPWRLGGKPLIGTYDECVVAATPAELCAQGYLAPYVGFSFLAPDLSGLKTTGGEYNEQQSAAVMMQPRIVNNIVEKWKAHASHLSTVVFAVTVEHSKQLTAEFRAAGARAEHLDGGTPLEQRRAILARVNSGVTQVLCNVGVAVEGLDIPRLKCCVLARPTKSLARAIQMTGRVRRTFEGQTARIHDHAFVTAAHGLPDSPRDYTLNAAPSKDTLPTLTVCKLCFAVDSGSPCSSCGGAQVVKERGGVELIDLDDADMVEFSSADPGLPPEAPVDPDSLPPVDVRWERIGREIKGVFLNTFVEQTQYGPLKRHMVRGERRRYALHGTTQLSAKLAKVKPGTKVEVKFTGETDLGGGRHRKEFSVAADEPDPREIAIFIRQNGHSPAMSISTARSSDPAREIRYRSAMNSWQARGDPRFQAIHAEVLRLDESEPQNLPHVIIGAERAP